MKSKLNINSLFPFKNKTAIHIVLFVITFITTVIAGMQWTTGEMGPYEFTELVKGLPYAISVLLFLSFHEFGHYFAAKYHKVEATLPYYIPFPNFFGTMGAVIRIKDRIPSNKAMFDIGVTGPIAGFIIALSILIYGFITLPDVNYILNIHPDYFSEEYGKSGIILTFGDTILFSFLKELFTTPGQFVPPMSEIYHYPYLCVGWFGLFVTSMNMIPVGQLDGGHVIYGMFGNKKHEAIASIFMILLTIFGIVGVIDLILELNLGFGWSGWLFWALILYFIIKVKHPSAYEFKTLDKKRMVIGIISIIIFIISFSPTPFIIQIIE